MLATRTSSFETLAALAPQDEVLCLPASATLALILRRPQAVSKDVGGRL